MGIDFYTYDIPIIVKGKEVFARLSVWDFGGQEQFKQMGRAMTIAGTAIVGAVGLMVKAYASFDKSMTESRPKDLQKHRFTSTLSKGRIPRRNVVIDCNLVAQEAEHEFIGGTTETPAAERGRNLAGRTGAYAGVGG